VAAERTVEAWIEVEYRPSTFIARKDDARALDEHASSLQAEIEAGGAAIGLE
jgi:hypothetical protein